MGNKYVEGYWLLFIVFFENDIMVSFFLKFGIVYMLYD